MTTSPDSDRAQILAVHKAWMDSNNGLNIDEMLPLFADPGYLQYNLNGHTYNSVGEKAKLWEGLLGLGMDLAECGDVEEPVVYIEGGLAYLTVIGSTKVLGEGRSGLSEGGTDVTFRVTEVYRKDDGKGNPDWKIWHFHCSPIADPSSAKYPQDA